MIEKMRETIDRHGMLNPGDQVVVGVSGGPDSLALLHGLGTLQSAYGIQLTAVHVNHMLRGVLADSDEAFVQSYCSTRGIPLKIFRVDVAEMASRWGCSFEEAGRRVRYEKLTEVANAYASAKIAVGQNKNDVVETACINLFRGAGIDGLASIEYKREGLIVRPLLDIDRSAIEDYCAEKGLVPRRDHTNEGTEYTRNKIRNELIPYLIENINPSVEAAISRTVDLMKEERQFWAIHCQKLLEEVCLVEPNQVVIKGPSFNALQVAEKKHLLRYAIKLIKGNLTDVSSELIEQILRLDRTGTYIQIDYQTAVSFSYGNLVVDKEEATDSAPLPKIKRLHVDRSDLETYPLSERVVALDADKVKGDLTVRHRVPGDRFYPLGMSHSKKIKDFFIDEKIPLKYRDRIWLVCDNEKILWVYGQRIDNRCKITSDTKNILLITLEDVVEN